MGEGREGGLREGGRGWCGEVARGDGGRPVQRDLTTMSVLKEEPELHFHGVPSAAVDDLALPRVALGIVLQELHDLSPDSLKDAARHPNIQKDLQGSIPRCAKLLSYIMPN